MKCVYHHGPARKGQAVGSSGSLDPCIGRQWHGPCSGWTCQRQCGPIEGTRHDTRVLVGYKILCQQSDAALVRWTTVRKRARRQDRTGRTDDRRAAARETSRVHTGCRVTNESSRRAGRRGKPVHAAHDNNAWRWRDAVACSLYPKWKSRAEHRPGMTGSFGLCDLTGCPV